MSQQNETVELTDLDLGLVAGGMEKVKGVLGVGTQPVEQKPGTGLGGTRGLNQLQDAIKQSRAPRKGGSGGWTVKNLGPVRG